MTNKELEKEIKELKAEIAKMKAGNTAVAKKNWNEYTWDELRETVANGTNDFEIDNEQVKEIELYSGEKCEVVCYENEKGCMKFAFVVDGLWKMNETDTNKGGYEASKMNTVFVPRWEKMLPEDMQGFKLKLPEYDELHENPILLNLISENEDRAYWWWTTQPKYTATFSCVSFSGYGGNGSAYYSYGVVLCFAISNQ